MFACVLEGKDRSLRRGPSPSGTRNFARPGERTDPGTDVDGDATDLALHDLALPCVETGAEFEVELAHSVGHPAGAADGACARAGWRSATNSRPAGPYIGREAHLMVQTSDVEWTNGVTETKLGRPVPA